MINHVEHPKIIGIYQVILGGMGAVSLLFQFVFSLSAPTVDLVIVSNLFFGFALFGICAYAGFRLFKRDLVGFELSIWIQALQIPKLTIAGFSYFFVVGPYIIFGVMEDLDYGLFFNLSMGQFHFGFVWDLPLYAFGINVGAASICYYLTKLIKLRKIENLLVNLKSCPYCNEELNLDRDNIVRTLNAFCTSCKSAINTRALLKREDLERGDRNRRS